MTLFPRVHRPAARRGARRRARVRRRHHPRRRHPQAQGDRRGRDLHARARRWRRSPSGSPGAVGGKGIEPSWTSSSTRASSTSPAFGIPVSAGGVADDRRRGGGRRPTQAGYPVVVKAQVQVGGRGKAGGIKLADDADEVRDHAGNILGMDIKGHAVRRVWVEHASDIAKEYYATFTLDRGGQAAPRAWCRPRAASTSSRWPTRTPAAIARLHIDPVDGLDRGRARRLVDEAGPRRRGHGRRGRHPAEAVPLLRRGRRRPGRDQPAHPHARGPGARARRQGDARRQRRLPPSRVGRVPRASSSSTSARRWPRRRACSTSASTATSASSPTAPAWP